MQQINAQPNISHNLPRPKINCPKCPIAKEFLNLEDLEAHLASEHYSCLPYECESCLYSKFPTEYAIRRHHEKDHRVNEFYYRCKVTPEIDEKRRLIRMQIGSVINNLMDGSNEKELMDLLDDDDDEMHEQQSTSTTVANLQNIQSDLAERNELAPINDVMNNEGDLGCQNGQILNKDQPQKAENKIANQDDNNHEKIQNEATQVDEFQQKQTQKDNHLQNKNLARMIKTEQLTPQPSPQCLPTSQIAENAKIQQNDKMILPLAVNNINIFDFGPPSSGTRKRTISKIPGTSDSQSRQRRGSSENTVIKDRTKRLSTTSKRQLTSTSICQSSRQKRNSEDHRSLIRSINPESVRIRHFLRDIVSVKVEKAEFDREMMNASKNKSRISQSDRREQQQPISMLKSPIKNIKRRGKQQPTAKKNPQIQCTKCKQWVANLSSSLIHHTNLHHSKIALFVCPYCGKEERTFQKSNAIKHIKAAHPEKANEKCVLKCNYFQHKKEIDRERMECFPDALPMNPHPAERENDEDIDNDGTQHHAPKNSPRAKKRIEIQQKLTNAGDDPSFASQQPSSSTGKDQGTSSAAPSSNGQRDCDRPKIEYELIECICREKVKNKPASLLNHINKVHLHMALRECALCGLKFECYLPGPILAHFRTEHHGHLPEHNIVDKTEVAKPVLKKQMGRFFRMLNMANTDKEVDQWCNSMTYEDDNGEE